MAKSSADDQLGIVRSTAVISLGLVALAGSIAAALGRRLMTAPTAAQASTARVSRLALDEWEVDLSRLSLPTKSEVEALQYQLVVLEAEIDQIIQRTSHSPTED